MCINKTLTKFYGAKGPFRMTEILLNSSKVHSKVYLPLQNRILF